MDPVNRFKTYLSKKNLRFTQERQEIIEAVFAIHNHFTVSDLIQELEKKKSDVGRSTVYRMIPHLLKSELVREARFCGCNEEQVYEHIFGHRHHDHLICEECGEVIEFEEKAIEILQEKVAAKYGYKLKKHFLDLRGVCPKCQARILDQALHP